MTLKSGNSSHERLLQCAKQLFATRGYANTSTNMIARTAGTSESQLVKHFGGKEGLLAAIFDQGWQAIADRLDGVDRCSSPAERFRLLIECVFQGLEGDPELREIMMLEGRRIRGEGNLVLQTRGYLDFLERLEQVLTEMRDQGQMHPDVPPKAVRSAIMGMCEGMMRDRVVANRHGGDAGYTSQDVHRVLDLVLPVFITRPATP